MKIVIIDDSKMILDVAKDLLVENKLSKKIFTFTNPKKALEFIDESVYIVITDLVMPKMNGIEVLKEIKGDKKLRKIKVLVLTSISKKEALKNCFKEGAFDYITKPFDEYEFIARVKRAIKERSLQKKLAKKLIDLNEEHEKLKQTQTELIKREQLAGIGQLAAGIAHELNNPLGYVGSNFSILKDYIEIFVKIFKMYDQGENLEKINEFKKDQDFIFIIEDINDLLKDTSTGINRAKEIVKSLRSFSRIDQIKEYSEYNLNKGIEETLTISKNEYKYIADIEKDLGDLPDILAYGGEINQVLLNIIVNAADAIESSSKNRGLIKIKTMHKEDEVICKISDNGIGINKNVLTKIFNPFFTTKDVGKGTGLGLSISYDTIVNKHDGSLEVNSNKNEGTEFIIKLPLDPRDDNQKED
ncbi:MAG: ATP-binding protein [Bacillota bacterium]